MLPDGSLQRLHSCKYDLVVYDNLYIINKHFSKKIEILYSEIPMNTNTTKC